MGHAGDLQGAQALWLRIASARLIHKALVRHGHFPPEDESIESQQAPASTPAAQSSRIYEKTGTYKAAAILMIAIGVVLAWLGDAWIFMTFLPFLGVWILCFILGLWMSKVIREKAWLSQKGAAGIFVAAVVLSYLPLLVYWTSVATTLLFPVMAALQGLGTAIGFYLPWIYGGKTTHEDVEGIDEFMSLLSKEQK